MAEHFGGPTTAALDRGVDLTLTNAIAVADVHAGLL
jgi:hypothetical protein